MKIIKFGGKSLSNKGIANVISIIEQKVNAALSKVGKPKRIDQRTAELSIASGNLSTQKDLQLPTGRTVRVKLMVTGADPAQGVNIAIKDHAGSDIIPLSHFKDWTGGNGEYFASMKHVNFDERNIVIHASSNTALAADFNAQLLVFTEVQ